MSFLCMPQLSLIIYCPFSTVENYSAQEVVPRGDTSSGSDSVIGNVNGNNRSGANELQQPAACVRSSEQPQRGRMQTAVDTNSTAGANGIKRTDNRFNNP